MIYEAHLYNSMAEADIYKNEKNKARLIKKCNSLLKEKLNHYRINANITIEDYTCTQDNKLELSCEYMPKTKSSFAPLIKFKVRIVPALTRHLNVFVDKLNDYLDVRTLSDVMLALETVLLEHTNDEDDDFDDEDDDFDGEDNTEENGNFDKVVSNKNIDSVLDSILFRLNMLLPKFYIYTIH